MYIYENGMRKIIERGTTAEAYRATLPKSKQRDNVYVRGKDKRLRQIKDDEPLPEGAEVYTVPEIKKGSSERLSKEIEFLKQVVRPSNYEVKSAPMKIGDVRYHAVFVKNVPLDSEKFDTSKTRLADILFLLPLLPPAYPLQPPIGCYLQFPHRTKAEADYNFTLSAHYGAPQLEQKGWYWYCVGFEGFNTMGKNIDVWKPAAEIQDGHNLATLLAMAMYAINTGPIR